MWPLMACRSCRAAWDCSTSWPTCHGTCQHAPIAACQPHLGKPPYLRAPLPPPDHAHAVPRPPADCQHVNDFFKRAGVATLTVRELFDFVVDPAIDDEAAGMDAELDRLMELASRWAWACG